MKNKFLMVAAVAVILIGTGCAKVPTPEIDLATATIQQAQDEEASVYQPEQLAAVKDSMNMVMELIEVQKSKLIPKYSDIKTKLANVTSMANQVKQNTEARKQALRQEAQTLIAEVTALNETNKSLAASAPKGKEGVTAIELINADIAAIGKMILEADALLTSGDLINALDKTRVAKEKAENIHLELKTVIEKSTRKTRK
ncbi:MAG: hypothetical protein K9H16_10330 [Bacteroidales bacterium]|nr:hypothetical protein [Bacteroidales bacterium]